MNLPIVQRDLGNVPFPIKLIGCQNLNLNGEILAVSLFSTSVDVQYPKVSLPYDSRNPLQRSTCNTGKSAGPTSATIPMSSYASHPGSAAQPCSCSGYVG